MATLRDVANASGVSTATVSHVLNGRLDKVGPETRERVLAAVRQLRYRPPALEHKQKAILTRNVGLMVPDITKNPILLHGYFRNVLDGVLEAAMFRGWSTTIFAERMWDDLGHAVRRSYDGRCDGLIIIAPATTSEVVGAMQERGVPLVLVGSTANLPGVSSVDIDNVAVGAAAAQHLLDLGHERFAFFGAEEIVLGSTEREQGFRTALVQAGIPLSNYRYYVQKVRPGRPSVGALFDEEEFFQIPPALRPTGLMAWHDGTAERLYEMLPRYGLRIPEDVSVIGVDDPPESVTMTPPLTTFRQPLPTLGKRAANLLIDRILDPAHPDEVVRFSIEFVLRESTAPPPSISSRAIA